MLKRYAGNPIIEPDPKNKLYPKKLYNPAFIKHENKYYLLFRGVGEDWISRIFLATSDDGHHFNIHKDPVIYPENTWENRGCEDPRIIFTSGRFWVTYTAFDGVIAKSAIASSEDLHHWHKHNLLFPQLGHNQRENLPADWSKSAAVFTEKINDTHYLLFGDNHIWSATSHNLTTWQPNAQTVIGPREGHFDSAYVEMGPPPIKLEQGWLILYHGINEFTDRRVYCLGAALVDHNDPLKVIWRCNNPILKPEEPYEKFGYTDLIPGGYNTLKSMTIDEIYHKELNGSLAKSVFCCGAILEDGVIRIYYGAADTRICEATMDLESLLTS